MFNGNGLTRTLNDNDKFQYNARLMWQPNGSQVLNQRAWVTGALYSESDFESTTTPIYAVAINWENQNNFNSTTGIDQKWNAYSARRHLQVQWLLRQRHVCAGCIAGRRPARSSKSQGGFIQAGQLFSRRRYEVAGRYGDFDPSDLTRRATTPRRLAARSATTTRGTA